MVASEILITSVAFVGTRLVVLEEVEGLEMELAILLLLPRALAVGALEATRETLLVLVVVLLVVAGMMRSAVRISASMSSKSSSVCAVAASAFCRVPSFLFLGILREIKETMKKNRAAQHARVIGSWARVGDQRERSK
jgi:hypothetical protein